MTPTKPAAAVFFTLAAGLAATAAVAGIPAGGPPDVLLIVADDQGYGDLGLLGNGIVTPALDRLAREGTRLTNFYVAASVCTPSRGALLTGRYPQRNGVSDLIRNEAPDYGHRYSPVEYAVSFERIGGMDELEVLLPEAPAPAGYTGAIYGKWDLGSLRRFLPTSRGFADFYGFVNTGIDYYTHERYGAPSMYRNLHKTEADRGVYTTDLFEREALRFLDERLGERRPGGGDGEPFLLLLPFNAPHSSSSLDPLIRSTVQAPEEYKAMYPPVPAETRTTTGTDHGVPVEVATFAARRRDYRAAVTRTDAAIGRVLDRLDRAGTLDETVVIFLSDNGGGVGADNAPLRGKKGQLWGGAACGCRAWSGGRPAACRRGR